MKIKEYVAFNDKNLVFFNDAGDQLFSIPSPGVLTSDAFVCVMTYEGKDVTGFAMDENGLDVAVANFRATRN